MYCIKLYKLFRDYYRAVIANTHIKNIYRDMYIFGRHVWADQKHRHALYRSKIRAVRAISTFYECYIRKWFKSVFRAIKPEILRHSP